MKPSDWPYYDNADDKSVYLLSILFLTWVSENTSDPPTSTAAGLKTFFYVILLSNIAAIIFIHGMSWAAWKRDQRRSLDYVRCNCSFRILRFHVSI